MAVARQWTARACSPPGPGPLAPPGSSGRDRRAMWWLVAGLIAISTSLARAAPPVAGEDRTKPKTIRLVIDYGDGVEKHFTAVPWRPGMTVLDVLQWAARHPRGIRFQYRGKKATAFLTSIDGLANEGGRGRNWLYSIDGRLGDRSFGVKRVGAGRKVLWRFGAGPYNGRRAENE